MAFSTFKSIFLVTDILLFLLVLSAVGFVLYARTREYYRTAWRQIRSRRLAMVCMGLVLLYAAAALLFHGTPELHGGDELLADEEFAETGRGLVGHDATSWVRRKIERKR